MENENIAYSFDVYNDHTVAAGLKIYSQFYDNYLVFCATPNATGASWSLTFTKSGKGYNWDTRVLSQYKKGFFDMVISIIKARRSWDGCILIMGIPILARQHIHIETAPALICAERFPDNEVYGANMGPTWALSAPDGPHDGPINLAIWVVPL